MGYKLLLADDEAEIRNGLSQYFPWSEVGFELVGQCDNGREAMEFLQGHEVDALLCDIRMPIMSGLDVARALHEAKSRVKVLFLSGYRDFEYAKQAIVYDVKSYIVKPTKYQELFEAFTSLKMELDQERGAGGADASFNEKVVRTIRDYVAANYSRASLENAASLVHMNPHYVSKYFKEKTGENFSDYVVSVRMNKAAELLKDIRYKTYQVSEMVGYSYAKNFTRTFKRFHGMSPREFRQLSGLDE
ncbi:MAG: response regulator [Paenibacillus sp.]|nr:response regulator [Paenibacillus sp.]